MLFKHIVVLKQRRGGCKRINESIHTAAVSSPVDLGVLLTTKLTLSLDKTAAAIWLVQEVWDKDRKRLSLQARVSWWPMDQPGLSYPPFRPLSILIDWHIRNAVCALSCTLILCLWSVSNLQTSLLKLPAFLLDCRSLFHQWRYHPRTWVHRIRWKHPLRLTSWFGAISGNECPGWELLWEKMPFNLNLSINLNTPIAQGLALSDALTRSCNWKVSSFPKDKCGSSAKTTDCTPDSLFGSSPSQLPAIWSWVLFL